MPPREAEKEQREAEKAAAEAANLRGLAMQEEQKAEEMKGIAAAEAAKAEEVKEEAKDAASEAEEARKAEQQRMEQEERDRNYALDRIAEEQRLKYERMSFVDMAHEFLGGNIEDVNRATGNKRSLASVYRRASVKVHPDKHKGSDEENAKYTEIFKILSDKYQDLLKDIEAAPAMRLKYRLYKHKMVRRHYRF
jgi:hypothetical protein